MTMNQKNENELSDNDIFLKKVFNKHVSSSIVSMFGVLASVMANTIIAGKFFGADGLAIMSVVAPFYSLFSTVGALAGVGGATLTSHALGRDDAKSANESFTLSLILGVAIYFFVAAICLVFIDPLLQLLGCSGRIFDDAREYAEIYIAGGLGTVLMYLPYNFFKLKGKLTLLKVMFLGMAALNVILDVVFVKFLYMGMDGIALGTVIAAVSVSLLGIKFLLQGDDSFEIIRSFNKKSVKELLKLGTPSALNNLLTFFRLMMMNRIIVSAAGSTGLAAFSVFSSLENLSLVILSGLAQATSAFVGVFSKELDTVSVRRIEKRAHIIGFIFVIPMMAAIMIFPTEICHFFGIYDSYKLELASNAACYFALSLPPSVCCLLMFFYYQSVGFTNLANVLIFCRSFLFLVGPAYFLTPIFGLDATWFSLTIASISPLVLMLIAMPFYFKKGYAGFFLQDLHAERDGTYISFAVKTNVDDIVDSVDKIAEFCQKNELSKKEVMLVRLSMEEMMMSIKEHCFEEDAEETMDVRILIIKDAKDLMIVLRIRNGGKLFNPIEYYERQSEDDPLAMGDALGISMIVNAADVIHYKTTFGINNLTVIIDRKEG